MSKISFFISALVSSMMLACGGATLAPPDARIQQVVTPPKASTSYYVIDACAIGGELLCLGSGGTASTRISVTSEVVEFKEAVEDYPWVRSLKKEECLEVDGDRMELFPRIDQRCGFPASAPTGSYATISAKGSMPFRMTLVAEDRILFQFWDDSAFTANRPLTASDRRVLLENGIPEGIAVGVY